MYRMYLALVVFLLASDFVLPFAVVSSRPSRQLKKWKPIISLAASSSKGEGEERTGEEPAPSTKNLSSSLVETEETKQVFAREGDSTEDGPPWFVKASLVAVGAFAAYNIVAFILTSVGFLATATLTAVGNEVVREANNVAENVAKLAGAAFGGAKVAAPAIGKAVVAGVKATAPVVDAASRAVSEAASPYVEDATKQLSSTAAPYVDAVDSTIKGAKDSVKSAVDSTVVSPIKEAIEEAAAPYVDAVDSTIKGATDSVKSAVDLTVVSPIKEAIEEAADSISNSVDLTIVAPIKEATDSVTSTASDSVTSVVESIKGAVPF